MTDLKPCPFCGNKDDLYADAGQVGCGNCGACSAYHGHQNVSITSWNTRAANPDTVTIKRSELCRAMGLLQACRDWKENAASTEALSILETALGEKK